MQRTFDPDPVFSITLIHMVVAILTYSSPLLRTVLGRAYSGKMTTRRSVCDDAD
jgi:hypothetical protein